jgi:hypothetical protein
MDQKEIDSVMRWVNDMKGDYTSEQLNEAFMEIAPKPYWKAEIDVVVPADKADILDRAIPYHCGGGYPTREDLGDGKIRLQHPGYWACVGS